MRFPHVGGRDKYQFRLSRTVCQVTRTGERPPVSTARRGLCVILLLNPA
jgi:hypothetical protein